MTCQLKLSTSFGHCPLSWRNFINYLQSKYNTKDGITLKHIDVELKCYNA